MAVAVGKEGVLKRKQPDSDNEEYEEINQYEDEDYELLHEEYADVDDEYEQVLAYDGMGESEQLEESAVLEEGEDGEQLHEEYNEEINSQYSDMENNEELVESNFNELEEEIDCWGEMSGSEFHCVCVSRRV